MYIERLKKLVSVVLFFVLNPFLIAIWYYYLQTINMNRYNLKASIIKANGGHLHGIKE